MKIHRRFHTSFRHAGAILVVTVTLGILGSILIPTFAAIPMTDVEPEVGTLTDGASVVSDADASAGKAVLFEKAATPPNTPPDTSITYPAQLLDLKNWKVTLPIDKDGGQTGNSPL